MAQGLLQNISLRGIVSAVPKRTVDNNYFSYFLSDSEIEKLSMMTGVITRRFTDETTTATDLCISAGEHLLRQLNWEPSSVDAIIFTTQTPDYKLPASSCIIQDKLGLSSHCAAFDLNIGCSGYVYGLWTVSSLISKNNIKRAILFAGDTFSKIVSPNDRSTSFIFGDACSATAIEYKETDSNTYFSLGTDGKGANSLIIPAGGARKPSNAETLVRNPQADGSLRSEEELYMDGTEIFNFTIDRIPSLVKEMFQLTNSNIDTVDYFLFHQANRFILNHLIKKLKLPPHKVPISIEKYGNTCSATIPLTICSELSNELSSSPSTIMMVGFGVGYSWGACLIQLDQVQCSIIEV